MYGLFVYLPFILKFPLQNLVMVKITFVATIKCDTYLFEMTEAMDYAIGIEIICISYKYARHQ